MIPFTMEDSSKQWIQIKIMSEPNKFINQWFFHPKHVSKIKQMEKYFTKTMLQIWNNKNIALIKGISPLISLITYFDPNNCYGLAKIEHLRA